MDIERMEWWSGGAVELWSCGAVDGRLPGLAGGSARNEVRVARGGCKSFYGH